MGQLSTEIDGWDEHRHGPDVAAGRYQQNDLLSRASNAGSVLVVRPIPSGGGHRDFIASAIISSIRERDHDWTVLETDQVRCAFVIRKSVCLGGIVLPFFGDGGLMNPVYAFLGFDFMVALFSVAVRWLCDSNAFD